MEAGETFNMQNNLTSINRGFSLVEALVATLILSFTGLALTKLQFVLSRHLHGLEKHSNNIHEFRRERELAAFHLINNGENARTAIRSELSIVQGKDKMNESALSLVINKCDGLSSNKRRIC